MNDEIEKKTILIEFRNISKIFGKFAAVSNINLKIYQGEVLGFLGPNGAGKSTTMKMMANLLEPTEGEVLIRQNDNLEKLTKHNQDELLENVGFLIENPAFYKNISPRQILTLFAKLKGYPRNKIKERVEEVVNLVGMSEWIDEKIGTFSKGMRQKIGVVSALVHDPSIIVLDEPHTGLDPSARIEVRDLILKLKEMNKTVFLSSHLLYEVSEVADRVAIISHGIIVACDTLDNLEEQAKQSIIDLEIISSEDPGSNIKKMVSIIGSYLNGPIKYTKDTKIYELDFDGTPEKQFEILNVLISNGIKVIEYSVPKAGLLESLYLKSISQSNPIVKQHQKNEVKVENVL